MKPRTEELLYLLLWGAEQLARPSFRNLTDSFEGWAYRNGCLRHLQDLEARQLLERQPGDAAQAICRLSESGCDVGASGRAYRDLGPAGVGTARPHGPDLALRMWGRADPTPMVEPGALVRRASISMAAC